MKPEATKFCGCIKSVRKTIKARKGKGSLTRRTEQGAIAVCVKSVLQTRGRTLKKFRCGKNGYLKTQKLRKGGAHGEIWASISQDVDSMTRAIERTPAKQEDYVKEFGKRYEGQEVPPVTDETRKYYEKAVRLTEPYPALHDYIQSMEQGSAGLRRMPMVMMRAVNRLQRRRGIK
jgi:hypothetical protein